MKPGHVFIWTQPSCACYATFAAQIYRHHLAPVQKFPNVGRHQILAWRNLAAVWLLLHQIIGKRKLASSYSFKCGSPSPADFAGIPVASMLFFFQSLKVLTIWISSNMLSIYMLARATNIPWGVETLYVMKVLSVASLSTRWGSWEAESHCLGNEFMSPINRAMQGFIDFVLILFSSYAVSCSIQSSTHIPLTPQL